MTDKKIDQVNDLIPLLEAMVQAKEPLLIVAEDVVGEALSALVVNKMRGVLDVVGGLGKTDFNCSCAVFCCVAGRVVMHSRPPPAPSKGSGLSGTTAVHSAGKERLKINQNALFGQSSI